MSASLRLVTGSDGTVPFCGMVGSHPSMLTLFEDVRHAAPLDSPVLIEGETGTGKELVAQALHTLSGRKGKIVAVNVAELAEPLAEAELFGAKRGAYTGAVAGRAGLIMSADGGTLFLDEAGDLPPPLQAKLLRVLEGGRIRQVGSEVDRVVRVRLVLSVQQSARDLVEAGRWRRDFYYRVAGITLRAPCLAERKADIPALANHFMVELGASPLPVAVLDGLASHAWAGNVRELKRVVERALHRARGVVAIEDLRSAIDEERMTEEDSECRSSGRTLRDVERKHIETVLREMRGDWHAASEVLGLSRTAFYRRLDHLGIPTPTRVAFPKTGMHSRIRGNRKGPGGEGSHLSPEEDAR